MSSLPSLSSPLSLPARFALPLPALLAGALLLTGCGKTPPVANPAESEFHALVAACTQSVAARPAVVQPDGHGGWTKTGFSAAKVEGEVQRTDTPATPYVGKIVIKDNHARATAATQAEAHATMLAPIHLLANRTHTFIYRHDGQRWHWQNGMRLSKRTSQTDVTTPLTLADVQAADDTGFAGCIPR